MNEQGAAADGHHRIWRQVLEFEVADEATAWRLRSGPDLARLHEERLRPILERSLNAVCPPGRLCRLETLTVDLGRVDLESLEHDLVTELERRLPEALDGHLRQEQTRTAGAGERAEAAVQLELLGYFALTGRVPWWADARRPDLVSGALVYLVRHVPRSLAALIRRLARQSQAGPGTATRDAAIRRVVLSTDDEGLAALVDAVGGRARLPEIRDLLERAAPPVLAASDPERFRHAVWQAVLLTTSLDPGAIGDVASFWRRTLARAAPATSLSSTDLVAALTADSTPGPWREVERALAGESSPRPSETEPRSPRLQEETELPELPDLAAADTDGVPIEACGVVLLWPFLGTFFEHLDVLHEGRFRSPEARRRAAGLLHHLATEELVPVEYQLTLPKVLCGLDPEDVFDFGPAVDETEAEACNDLLRAVIGHAEILNDMSIPGFRGTFLLRRGVLRSEGGSWLLRVERETYDVVLDRFPWVTSWVKLQWMEAPLQVEW